MANGFQASNQERFATAIRRFDEENARDPHREVVNGVASPRELVYAQWLTDWVVRLCPHASEELRLAARSQHIRRWESPRESYPNTRAGYLRWRETLKQFHARESATILREVGYSEEVIRRVETLITKGSFPHEPESRVLEDALCLVFIERQLSDLAAKTSEEKLLNALRKSWAKMSADGRAAALKLQLTPSQKLLLEKAVQQQA